MEPHGLMSGLPSDYLLVHFHRFHQVKTAAKQVFDALIKNEDGNQFIVVLSLSETARQRLDGEEDCWTASRFASCGKTMSDSSRLLQLLSMGSPQMRFEAKSILFAALKWEFHETR